MRDNSTELRNFDVNLRLKHVGGNVEVLRELFTISWHAYMPTNSKSLIISWY